MKPLTVINLFAGPGAGKSTTAAGVFRLMKLSGYNVELVTEYAKDMTWEKRFNTLSDQLYMFGKQHRRQHRLKGQVDYVVTDSPLLLSLFYKPEDYSEHFEPFVLDMWNMYDNRNFFIDRTKPYVTIGRNQTEEEARAIDRRILNTLGLLAPGFITVPGNECADEAILLRVIKGSNPVG